MKHFIVKNLMDERRIGLFSPAIPLTLEQVRERIDKNAIEIEEHELPKDNYWFNAMVYRNKKIEIDMDLAKEETKGRIRYERKPLLEALDIFYQRALENNKKRDKIEKEKQRLRDLPLAVENKTLDELKELKVETKLKYEDLEDEELVSTNGEINVGLLADENNKLKTAVNYLESNLKQLTEILKKNYVI